MPGKGFELHAAPSEAGEQRELRPAIWGQGSSTPSSAPPHEVASLLVQPAMLGGRDLASRALDQCGKAFTREPTDLDAPALDLRVELRPVGEYCGGRVEESKQAAWGAEVLSSDGPSSAVGGVPSLLEDSDQTSRP